MTFKKLTEATKTKYTEADFAWDEKAMIAEYKAAVLDYMNGASMDDALKAIKAMLKSGGETIVKGKGPVRESRTAKIAKLKLHEEFKLYENMWESVETSTLNEDWYGADAEVEFETSVYPDIAKYFGLKDDEVVTYAYYYTDEVIVNYDDATGHSHEIEKHVPLDQVEEWFKAGYTILDEAKKPLTEARSVADIEAEIARLQQELAQAKEDEKRVASKGTKSVWFWDMYVDAADKGSWTSIDQGIVFETKDKATDAGWNLLGELDDEGELNDENEDPIDPDEYVVEAIEVPLARVPESLLIDSDLHHLWDPATAYEKAGRCPSCSGDLLYNPTELSAGFQCPYCGTKLKGRAK